MLIFKISEVFLPKREIKIAMSERDQKINDAYSPDQIAIRIEELGVNKAKAPFFKLFLLAILAGAFISMGAIFYTVVITDSNLGFGMTRLIGGITFSSGLILVVIAGAELFTGNNLMAMAWVDKKISTQSLLRNWSIVYLGNVVGCLITVILIYLTGLHQMNEGAVQTTAVKIAQAKYDLTFLETFAKGILCNALVCIAVWLVMAGRSVTDKILAVIFPVTAFVTLGFEHVIANWFFLPYAMLLDNNLINENLFFINILASTLGNIFGGTILVAGIYYFAYRHRSK